MLFQSKLIVYAERPTRRMGYASAWIRLGILTAFVRGVFIAQEKRIRALDDRLAQLQGK